MAIPSEARAALSRMKKTAKEIQQLHYKMEITQEENTREEIKQNGGVTLRSLIMRGPSLYWGSRTYIVNGKEYTKDTLPLKWVDKNICDFELWHKVGQPSKLTLMFSDMSEDDYVVTEDDALIVGNEEDYTMNKQKRDKVEKICKGLRTLLDEFEEVLDDERATLDNYPENLQLSYKYDDAVDYLDELDAVRESLEEVVIEFESSLR